MTSQVYVFNDTVLFVGRLPANDWHKSSTTMLASCLHKNFHSTIENQQQIISAKTLLFSADLRRKTEYSNGGLVAILLFPNYLVLNTAVESCMTQSMHDPRILSDISNQTEWLAFLQHVYDTQGSIQEVKKGLIGFFEHRFKSYANHNLFDIDVGKISAPIANIVQKIKYNVAFEGDDTKMVESQCMSAQHLRRVFKKEVGTSMSKFTTYQRMIQALRWRSKGLNLTDSILSAGYFDLCHSNKSYKHAYGIGQQHIMSNSHIQLDETFIEWLKPRNRQTELSDRQV